MKQLSLLALVAVGCAALALLMGGCAKTEFVPTPVNFGVPKPPSECFFPDHAKKDLSFLTMPAGDVTLLSLAASTATTHRQNRYLYRTMREAFKVCSRYVRRLPKAKV